MQTVCDGNERSKAGFAPTGGSGGRSGRCFHFFLFWKSVRKCCGELPTSFRIEVWMGSKGSNEILVRFVKGNAIFFRSNYIIEMGGIVICVEKIILVV